MMDPSMIGTLIISIFVAIFALIFVYNGFKMVQQSKVMVIERLGKYNRTLQSGINIIIPLIDKPRSLKWRYVEEDKWSRAKRFVSGDNVPPSDMLEGYMSTIKDRTEIDLRETVYDFPGQNVITKDNVNVRINALLYFQIVDPVKSVYEIENLPVAIEKLTQTTLRNVIGELELDETLSSRDTINSKLRTILDDATNKWGVKVNRVELQDINPPADIIDAMEKQMRAERDRRAAVLEADGAREAEILKSQGEKESQIKIAEGKRQASILVAEGNAEARRKEAAAEAEAIKLIADTIGSKESPVNYLVANRYIDTLGDMVKDGKDTKTVYIPYEATGVLSSLGGIKEMFGKK